MALRRQVRLRKEFLYRKANEAKDAEVAEKKRKIRAAMEAGRPIPTELRQDAVALERDMALDGAGGSGAGARYAEGVVAPLDDEYADLGQTPPHVCVTTSREPSSRLKQFAKEIKVTIPNSAAVNRGNHKLSELLQAARRHGFTDVVVLSETRGEPDGMVVCHLPLGPTAYFTLSNAVLRHDIPEAGPLSQQAPHLVVHNMESRVGKRAATILRALFPPPKAESRRVVSLVHLRDDFISFRQHVYTRPQGRVELQETGPRFEMQLYKILLGTADQDKEADTEWLWRPYMNSARRGSVLS